jgi:tRNA nucleotidyltransferase (CCA-adding enzyme)
VGKAFPESLHIPDPVLTIVRRLEDAGYETWCVGGAVRDGLLGLERGSDKLDLATAAAPDVVRRLFRRTVPVGIEHGTVGVLDDAGGLHEVTTFRRDVRTDGRHAEVAFGVSLDEDLARRDFTINAIAYHPLRRAWRDPFGGQADLERRLIRAVGEPGHRFREDYLRVVRALRFSARFRFTIEEATWAAARAAVPGLTQLSAERVRDEWSRGLASAKRASELVELWDRLGALDVWLPELVSRDGGTGTLEAGVVDRLPGRDAVLMTACLSSDPVATLTRLRFSNAEIERGRRIAAHRTAWPEAGDLTAVRRWMAAAGAAVDDLVAIAGAEGWGGPLAAQVESVRRAGAPLTVSDLAVSGEDLLAAGVPRGPMMGEVLRALLDEVLEDPARNTSAYLASRIPLHVSHFTLPPGRGEGSAEP